jgi:hypothetical protein
VCGLCIKCELQQVVCVEMMITKLLEFYQCVYQGYKIHFAVVCVYSLVYLLLNVVVGDQGLWITS